MIGVIIGLLAMSRYFQNYQACSDKPKYSNKKLASKALQKGKSEGYLKPSHHAYRCNFCCGWHIGHIGD